MAAATCRTASFIFTPLDDLLSAFGDRPAALCRELTKLHEETLRLTLAQADLTFQEMIANVSEQKRYTGLKARLE